jgi:protein SCO1/2
MTRAKALLVVPFVLFAAIILATLFVERRPSAGPPVLATVPAFTLTDPKGEPFGSANLSGSVYVASFFFTRCRSICPAMMHSVAELQDRYAREGVAGVRLVSFTVDPEADDPSRLRQYGEELGVDPARWTLLTGELDSMRALVLQGFQVPMGAPEVLGEDLIDVAHSAKLLLIDGQGRVRGHYDSADSSMARLFDDSVRLARAR